MRNGRIVGGLIALLIVGTLAVGWLFLKELKNPNAKTRYKVAVIFDKGGQGDKGFNDMAFAGLQRARRELGDQIATTTFEASSGGDNRELIMRLEAENGADLVIGVGHTFAAPVVRVATEHPGTHFAVIDGYIADLRPESNVTCLLFRAEEGSFLVGEAAAMKSKTGSIGFIGGMEGPLIQSFEAGYFAGARYVNPNIVIISDYIGRTVDAYFDPDTARKLSTKQYDAGADIIFAAAGASGEGVLDAAVQAEKLMIGVDQDRSMNSPPDRSHHILTSMVKRIDNVVYTTILSAQQGKLVGGYMERGLADNAVGYAENYYNGHHLENIKARLDETRQFIIDKKIVPPHTL